MILKILETLDYRKKSTPHTDYADCCKKLFSDSSWTDANWKIKAFMILQQTTENNNNIFALSCTDFVCRVDMFNPYKI